MVNQSKLKPLDSSPIIGGVIGGLIFTAISIFIWVQFGESTVDKLAGAVFSMGALIHIVVWYRTGNIGYFTYMCLAIIMAIRLLAGFSDPLVVGAYRVVLVFLIGVYLFFLATGKMKWQFRKILELAASPVDSTEDGFTPRPFPAGVATYTREEIIGFGRFLSKNLIAIAYFQPDRVVLSVSNQSPRELFFPGTATHESTYISFAFDGRVSVQIARREYELYKEELTFDQLCTSMADLFKTLLDLYKLGKKDQILAKIRG